MAYESINAQLGGDEVAATHHEAQKAHKAAKRRKRRYRRAKRAADQVVHQTYMAAERAGDQQYRRNARKAPDDVATEPGPKSAFGPSYKPTNADVLGDQITDDLREHAPGAENKVVAALSGPAKTGADIATILPIGPGGDFKLGTTLGRAILKKAGVKIAEEGAEGLGKREAVREVEKAAVRREARAGGTEVVEKGVSSEAKAEAKAVGKRTARKVRRKVEKAERDEARAIRKDLGKSTRGDRVREGVGRQAKKRQPDVITKAGRQAKLRRGLEAAPIAAPVVAGVGTGIGESTVNALQDDPGKTIGTTARSIPGLVTAPLGILADVGETGKNLAQGKDHPLAPLAAELEAQKKYYDQYAKAAEGGEKGQKVIENQLGLTPAISAVLAGHAATRGYKIPHTPNAEPRLVRDGIKVRRVKKLKEEVADPTSDRADDAARLLAEAEKRRDKRANKRSVAQRLDVSKRRGNAGFHEDLKERGGTGGDAKTLRSSYQALAKTKVTDRVNMSDVAHLVLSEGIPLDREAGLRELSVLRDSLVDTDRTPSLRAKGTREVLDAIMQRPELLEDPNLEALWEASAKARHDLSVMRHEERVGVERAAGRPDPLDDRPRLLPVARSRGILTPEERHHPELADNPDGHGLPNTRKYKDADKAVRDQAKNLMKRAKRAERDAAVLRRHDAAGADQLMVKAQGLRDAAEARLSVVNRPKLARKLDAEAYELKQAGDKAAAREVRARAEDLRRSHQAARDQRLNEYRDEVGDVISSGERREPVFFHDYSAEDIGGLSGGQRFRAGAGLSKGEKMRSGKLREMGLVDHSGHSTMEGMFRDRANHEMGMALRDILDRHMKKLPFVTGPEARRMIENGTAPTGQGLIPVQEFKRAYKRGDWEHAMGLMDGAIHGLLDDVDFSGAKGKKYAWVSNSALKELYDQMEPTGKWANNLRKFGGLQSFALLGTSPTWVAFQGIATPMMMLARHPNPRTWARAVKNEVQIWKSASPREKAAFNAEIGGNVGDVASFRSRELGPTPDNIRSMSDAAKLAGRSTLGRMLHAIVGGGGPLVKGVAKYEGVWRHLEAVMEMDKLHNPSAAKKFITSVAHLEYTTEDHISKLDGLSAAEQHSYYAKHPGEMKELTDKIDGALGDWSSLTKAERNASAVLIFYPFLRFSLKWMFQTFPRDNPIKMGILANLAQQNAQEVEKITRGAPSFFQDYGKVPFFDQEGKVTGGLNLGRVAPGSNALTEMLGDGTINGASVARTLQPVLGSAVAQGLFGVDPFTGKQVDTNRGLLFAQQILGLNPITRAALLPKIKDQSDVSKLYGQIEDKSPWEKAFVPDFTFSAGQTQAAQQISENLDKSSKAPSTDEIAALAQTVAQQLDGKEPNDHNLKEIPAYAELRDLIKRQRTSDAAGDQTGAWLSGAGLGESDPDQAAFNAIYSALSPYKGRWHYRSSTDKARYRRKQGLPPKDDSSSPWSNDWGGNQWGGSQWDSSSNWGG